MIEVEKVNCFLRRLCKGYNNSGKNKMTENSEYLKISKKKTKKYVDIKGKVC